MLCSVHRQRNELCVDSLSGSPQNSFVEILAPDVIVLGDGDFRRELGLDSEILLSVISTLTRGDQRAG